LPETFKYPYCQVLRYRARAKVKILKAFFKHHFGPT
jgi:hypothetical protein